LALIVSGSHSIQAQDRPSAPVVAGPQADLRPVVTSLMNGSIWPQHKGERETQFESSVVIQVDGDAPATHLGSPAAALLTTSALVEQATHKATGVERARVREAIQVIATSAGLKMTRLEVRLLKTPGVDWKADDADKVIHALADGLRAALNQSAVAASRLGEEDAAEQAKEVAEVNQKMADLQKEKEEVRRRLAEIPPQYVDRNIGARSIANELQNVEQQLRMNEEQLASKNPAASELLNEWQELVRLREEKLKSLKAENGPAAEVRDAEIALAESRAKLSQAHAGTGRSERSEVAEISRLKARIEQGKRQQAELTELAQKLKSADWQGLLEKQQELSQTEDSLRNEQMMLRSRRPQFRQQPTGRFLVTILDGRE
jgi:DNA repair exonuclease SbcCD ATPase subunit